MQPVDLPNNATGHKHHRRTATAILLGTENLADLAGREAAASIEV